MVSEMDEVQLWRTLRLRMLLVPLEQRREWTDRDLRDWWQQTQHRPELEKQGAMLLSFNAVKGVCRGLIGKAALA